MREIFKMRKGKAKNLPLSMRSAIIEIKLAFANFCAIKDLPEGSGNNG